MWQMKSHIVLSCPCHPTKSTPLFGLLWLLPSVGGMLPTAGGHWNFIYPENLRQACPKLMGLFMPSR